MIHTFTTTSDVGPSHQLVISVPEDVPLGRVKVTVTVESEVETSIQTLGDLLTNGFAGRWAGRTDLPNTDEEFRVWRRKAWERGA